MKTIEKKAYAKVNLALDVLRKRPDGYHDVKMIMQNLSLCDELTFSVDENTTEGIISISTNKESVPTDERNLIYKAIKLMYETYGLHNNISVKLIKNIPVEAGMAGGSTDCAAAIKAVNELFDLKLSIKKMQEIGVKLGADVPFCILGKTAVSEGIGEILTEIPGLKECYVLVAKPPISVSTAFVYKNLKADEIKVHPDVDGMAQALKNNDLSEICKRMSNVLETVTACSHPEIIIIENVMKNNGAINSIMSGSGPTVFGIFDSKEQCEKTAKIIRDEKLANEVYVTVPV